MDLKIEILESYSRIHNRLLEGADPRIAQASQVIANGNLQSTNTGMQSGNVPRADGGMVDVRIFKSGSIVVGGANAKFNGTVLTPGKNPEQFLKILTMLAGPLDGEAQEPGAEGEEGQEEMGMEEQVPIQPGQITMMADLSDETKNITALNFVNIAGRAQAIWSELPQSMQQKFGSIEAFSNFLTGPNPESFEKQLVAAKISLRLVDGNWTAVQEPPQESQTSLISESFRDLVDIVADGKCNGEVIKDFATTKTGDVLISPKGDHDDRSEALAFRDTTGFLKMLINKASKICNKEIQRKAKLRTSHTSNPGGDNAIRGFAFEDILETVSLLRLKKKMGKGNEASPSFTKLLNDKIKNIHEKLSKLTLENEVWVKAYEESGLDPNQVGMIREISDILQGGALSNNLYASMIKHSNQSVKVRGSLYALPVGDQTGSGQRQDVLEIFATPEDAMAAAKRSGISNIKPTCDTVEKAFVGSAKGTLSALKRSGVFHTGQTVCALKVSLKNYMKLDHAIFGGGRFSTFKDLINKPLDKSPFAKTIAENLGMDEADHETFMEYAGEMDDIGGSVYSVPMSTNMVTKNGDKLNQNTAKNFAEEILVNLNKNNTFPELAGGEMGHLKAMAEKVAKDTGSKHEISAAYSKLQHRIAAFLQHKKLQKDLSTGGAVGRKAKMFAAFKMFHAGGSDDDNLVCDYRGLATEENYVFKQNDPLRDAWKSVMDEDGEWDLSVTAGEPKTSTRGKKTFKSVQIKLVRGNQHLTVTNDTVATKGANGKVTGYNVNYNCQVNRALMQSYSTSSGILESKELGEILSHIKLLFEKVAIIGIK